MANPEATPGKVDGKALLVRAFARGVKDLGAKNRLFILLPGHIVEGTLAASQDTGNVTDLNAEDMDVATLIERVQRLAEAQGVSDRSLRNAIVLEDAVIHSPARTIRTSFCVLFTDDVVGFTAGQELGD